MKKFSIVGIVFMILVLSSITSCDKEETVDPIVGIWEYSESMEGLSITITLTFNTDNTGSSKVVYVMDGITDNESANFTYSTNGSKLTITSDGESDEISYSISGDKLTITEDGEDMVFIRK